MRRLLALAVALAGCSESVEQLTYQQALDPESCKDCHPDHYREWSGSMHAFAGDDPVFIAMNERGQRETIGELGDFCVQCHAPVALAQGLTTDGLDLDQVPKSMRGVTCAFCHLAKEVTGTHNNPIVLDDEVIMRGAFEAADGAAHRSEPSPLHDRSNPESSNLCGSCHDIVTPADVHLEQTFLEWKESLYAHETPAELQTCGRCHMPGRDGVAAEVEGVPLRRITDHKMVGVDVATIDWPEKEAQREAIQRMLDPTVFPQLCVRRVQGGTMIEVDLENFAAGHSFPSGATFDRRAWVEIVATLGGAEVFVSGRVEPDQAVVTSTVNDPWHIFDVGYGEGGDIEHMFWDIRTYDKRLLSAPTAISPIDPEWRDPHVKRSWTFNGVADRIEMNVHIRPIGLDVLDDLIDSGDLAPQFRTTPTFTLRAANLVWTADLEQTCIPE